MSYVFATIAIVGGLVLMLYSLSTAKDKYWSPSTRMMGIVGTAVGVATFVLGLWSVTW